MTYGEICERLRCAGIENFSREAVILVEEICGTSSLDGDFDSPRLAAAVEKRCARYPLQYIIGKWWLANCEFFVDNYFRWSFL